MLQVLSGVFFFAPMKHLQAQFTGNVQGVGFRYTACHYAREFEICGTVQNLSNGSVQLYAVGDGEQIEQFIQSLKKAFSKDIERVDMTYLDTVKNYSGFRVIYT